MGRVAGVQGLCEKKVVEAFVFDNRLQQNFVIKKHLKA